jgi:UDPglucose 6-dehydrogenase
LKVAVVGLGYAGLCTAACAAKKFDVIGVDVDSRRIPQLRDGQVPFHEKGIPELIKKPVEAGALGFSDSYDSLDGAGTIFVTIGTSSKADGSVDLSQVAVASKRIGRELARSKNKPLVVIMSTVTPGTSTNVARPRK